MNNQPAEQVYNQFDIQKTVQSIWAETDLVKKKERMINEVVSNFKFKEKQAAFKTKINGCKKPSEVDRILTNIVLHGEGLNSIKI